MDEKLIQHHMRTLKCTREEAIQLIADDHETDRGIAHDWDLTKEQMKNARKLANAGTRKVSKPAVRTRKENPAKQEIIRTIANALSGAENLRVTNAERTIDFTADGVEYTITLTAHRAKKQPFFLLDWMFSITKPKIGKKLSKKMLDNPSQPCYNGGPSSSDLGRFHYTTRHRKSQVKINKFLTNFRISLNCEKIHKLFSEKFSLAL